MSLPSFRSDHRVLIVAPDALLAALIGVLVEASRLQPAFPRPGEPMDAALARVRPLAAVLVDALSEDAGSDVFLARARRSGVPVLMFGPAPAIERRARWAEERNVPTFALPRDIAQLSTELGQIARARQHRQERSGERRATAPRVERGASGELMFDDGDGHRWHVYDRRAGDRRNPSVERQFVSESGEVRRCTISVGEAKSTDAQDLSRQLAEAVLAT